MKFHDFDGQVRSLWDLSDMSFSPEWLGIKLGNIRRFQGNPKALTDREHSIMCAQIALTRGLPLRVAAWCLTHDLAEAFLGDWHGPSKTIAQRSQERIVNAELACRGWLLHPEHPDVKAIDVEAYEEERRRIWPEVYGEPKIWLTGMNWVAMVRKVQAFQ